jgi:hypothetical protein
VGPGVWFKFKFRFLMNLNCSIGWGEGGVGSCLTREICRRRRKVGQDFNCVFQYLRHGKRWESACQGIPRRSRKVSMVFLNVCSTKGGQEGMGSCLTSGSHTGGGRWVPGIFDFEFLTG